MLLKIVWYARQWRLRGDPPIGKGPQLGERLLVLEDTSTCEQKERGDFALRNSRAQGRIIETELEELQRIQYAQLAGQTKSLTSATVSCDLFLLWQ
jgi:hypothetical protein